MRLVLALLLVSANAFAADALTARQHFDRAQTHFAVGEFTAAGDEYLEAYKLKPDPALLYNAAQSYRLGGNQEKALVLYKNYVTFYKSQPNVAEVKVQIAKLQEAIAAAEKAKSQPPTDTAEPKPALPPATTESAPPAATTTTETSTPAPATTATTTATTTSAKTPVYKKWWLWTIVGVVVVGAVVAGAVVATTPSGSWSNAPEVGPGHQALGVRF
jgi:tetratricopeptide (TPR) repeat protein